MTYSCSPRLWSKAARTAVRRALISKIRCGRRATALSRVANQYAFSNDCVYDFPSACPTAVRYTGSVSDSACTGRNSVSSR